MRCLQRPWKISQTAHSILAIVSEDWSIHSKLSKRNSAGCFNLTDDFLRSLLPRYAVHLCQRMSKIKKKAKSQNHPTVSCILNPNFCWGWKFLRDVHSIGLVVPHQQVCTVESSSSVSSCNPRPRCNVVIWHKAACKCLGTRTWLVGGWKTDFQDVRWSYNILYIYSAVYTI